MKGNLPFELSSFVGRARETEELATALAASRLVTLTGPGGAGKSRLALHVARQVGERFPDGVWLVQLDELQDERLLADAVISMFGIPDGSGRSPEEALAHWLTQKRLLVVLDNGEHLVGACRRLVADILPRAPEVRVLVTSRHVLGADGEVVWRIPPLSLPESDAVVVPEEFSQYEALALFEQRARAARPDFTITPANAAVVAELCRRLDGGPLALELAAVQVRALTIGEILAHVDRPLTVLQAPWQVRGRKQSLRAVVEASFALCSPGERRIWISASVFAGGFDLEAAHAVCGLGSQDDAAVSSTLDGLVDKSVISVSLQGQKARFRMLETIRQFGAEQLAASADAAAVRRRHRDHFLAVARRAEREWSGPRQPEWLAYLRGERANLRSALDFSFEHPGEDATGVAFAGLLWPLWIVGGFLQEGSHWIDRALRLEVGSDPDRLRAASIGALVACLEGDVPRARAMQESMAALAVTVGEPDLLAIAARAAGTVEMLDGNLAAATPYFERSLETLQRAGTPHSLALVSHADLGVVHSLSGAFDDGVVRCEQGRTLCQAQGETWALSWILFVLSFIRLVQDEDDDVTRDLERMLRIKRDFDDVLGILQAAELLAWVAARREPRRAARILGANEALWRPLGRYLLSFAPYLARHERCQDRARELLGDRAFEQEFRAGAAMDLKQLAAFALGEDVPAEQPVDAATRGTGLTAREREICALVAESLTDKQIAERLVLSPRTVQTHVANILGKLGFHSRTEIVRWAGQQEGPPDQRADAS